MRLSRAGVSALSHIYVRYILASVLALGVDLGLFLSALALGIHAVAASALGYCAGIVVHWLISSHVVFAGRVAPAGSARLRQQSLFLVSALAGLAITVGIVGSGAAAGVDARLAKLIAIVVSFQATYLLRRWIVFA